MLNTKISVVVPAYNAEKTIERCILSVLHQTYSEVELVLVDDGSTDGTAAICDKYGESDARVVAIHKCNEGVSVARNVGIDAATGEYLMFADADDFLDSTMCDRLIMAVKADGSDVAVCGYKRVKSDRSYKKTGFELSIVGKEEFSNIFYDVFENALFNSPCNKIYRKSLVTTYFDKDLSIGEDLVFNLAYFKNSNKFTFIKESLYNYVIGREDSLSASYKEDLFENEKYLYHRVLEFCETSFGGASKSAIDRVFAKEVYYYLKKLVLISGLKKPDKLKKMKECINDEDVKNISLKDIKDKQIKILFFLAKKDRARLICQFFNLKKFLFERI